MTSRDIYLTWIKKSFTTSIRLYLFSIIVIIHKSIDNIQELPTIHFTSKNLSNYISSQTVRSQSTKLFQLDESGWWARGVNQNRFSRLLPIWHGEALLYPLRMAIPHFTPSRRAFGILRVLSKALKASEKGCKLAASRFRAHCEIVLSRGNTNTFRFASHQFVYESVTYFLLG